MSSISNQFNAFHEGCSVSLTKTISESHIMQFAEISGDFSPNHVDEEFMKNSSYGERIAHGALLVAYMSHASSLILEKYPYEDEDMTAVSLGYDRIRFIKPVFINDVITIVYTVEKHEQDRHRSLSKIEIVNQEGTLVAVAQHILQWVPNQIK